MIYRYIVIIWCIIEPISLQAQQTLSVPIYRNLQSYSEMKLSADTGFYKTDLSAGNIMIPVHGVDTWEKKLISKPRLGVDDYIGTSKQIFYMQQHRRLISVWR